MPSWTYVYLFAFWPLLLASCCAAIVWGDRPVRSAALLFFLAMFLTSPLILDFEFKQMEIGYATVDLLFLVGLMWTSLRWPRWWLILISSLQLLMVLGHVAKMMWPASSRLTYAIMTGGAAYLQLILLSIGVLVAIRSRRSGTSHHVINWRDGTHQNTGLTPTE